jgi:hypothetical protein
MQQIVKYLDRADRNKAKMLEIKAELNKLGFRLGIKNASYIDLVLEELPELNSPQGRNKIKNVWTLRQTDEKILSAFVIILQKLAHE